MTPPEIAKRFSVSVKKVLEWIRTGELPALNLARRACNRPRYSISVEALETFERLRRVVPDDGEPRIGRIRRKSEPAIREFV
jgi:excisionase family DNA binding protein